MSDIRFNRWLHQSGTGGVYQDSTGRVGIGTSVPTSALDVQSGTIKIGSNTLSSSGVSTFTTVNTTTLNSTTVSATTITGVTTAGITTAYIGAINDGPISGARNRIINGDMRIDQRNSGLSTTGNGSYTVDRWTIEYSGNGSITGIQTSDVPTGQGFTNALKLTSTARSTLGSGDFYQIAYYVEGYDTANFDYGSSSARTVTLSFWVKASRTGTYQVNLANAGSFAGTRTHTKTYTVSVADTWQKVILTYPGCTTGTWEKASNTGIGIRFGFEYGSFYTSGATADTWISTSSFADSFVTTTNTFTTNSNSTWFITGVQLEQGPVATEFERRSYSQELQLCMRYFQRYLQCGGAGYIENNPTVANGFAQTICMPVEMRAVPSATCITASNIGVERASLFGINSTTGSVQWMYRNNIQIIWGLDTTLTRWHVAWCRTQTVSLSAEIT
jgi:hypothetical protein